MGQNIFVAFSFPRLYQIIQIPNNLPNSLTPCTTIEVREKADVENIDGEKAAAEEENRATHIVSVIRII